MEEIDSYWDIPKFVNTYPDVVILIVNGEEVITGINMTDPFSVTVARALRQSHNTGRPATDWELRDLDGNFLDDTKSPESYGVEPGTRFFLTLHVGAGGGERDWN